MDLYKALIFTLLCGFSFCNSYRILAIFPYNGKSHQAVLQSITRALSEKGHQVDIISHYPLKDPPPNYRDIIRLSKEIKFATVEYKVIEFSSDKSTWLKDIIRETCEYLGHPQVAELIKELRSNNPYDLLLIHHAFSEMCYAAIGQIIKVPVVSIMTTSPYTTNNFWVDSPLNLAIVPTNECGFEHQVMTFWDRLSNVVNTFWGTYDFYKGAEVQYEMIKKYLGPDVPDHLTVEKTGIDLLLTSSHFSYHGVKPKSPAMIEIGGIHIKNDTTPIDPKLKKLLDNSKDGFIYFSFGSLTAIETFPSEILERFYSTFRKLSPIPIIMRVARPELMPKNKPNNLFMYTWLPQQQILQHPNIKAFVTHGGAHGTQEAVYHQVPMICVPLFAEQKMNCDILRLKEVALKIHYKASQQKDYDFAFKEIISNPIYKNNMVKFSALFRDRPRNQTDEAVYWIEYVVRHGRGVLRSPAKYMSWWQIELFDIYAFIAACILVLLGIFIFVILKTRSLWMSLRKRFSSSKVKQISKKLN